MCQKSLTEKERDDLRLLGKGGEDVAGMKAGAAFFLQQNTLKAAFLVKKKKKN